MEGADKPSEPADLKQHIDSQVDTVLRALESYEKDHPHWQEESVLWIMEWALRRLRVFIDDPREADIAWDNPFVEMHFPVECSWHEDDGKKTFSLNSGTITWDNTADRDSGVKTLSRIMARQIEIVTLQDLTNNVAFEKHGDDFLPMIDTSLGQRLLEIDAEEDKKRFLEDLFRPRSFGAGRLDIEGLVEGEEMPPSVLEEFDRDWQHIEPPLISIPLTVDDVDVILAVILEIQPLVADPTAQEAYFPITIGLALQCPEDEVSLEWVEAPQTSLEQWDDEGKEKLWEILFAWLAAHVKHLHSAPVPEFEEAVMTVNATIRIPVDPNDPQREAKTRAALRNQLEALGEMASFDATLRPPSIVDLHTLSKMVEAVESASKSEDKGKRLEELVSALFSSIEGFTVLDHRLITATEEIDLVVENDNGNVAFRNEGDLILIECKNWSGKCGKNDLVIFQQKIENRSGRVTLGFLVSWNGFAETVPKEMLRGSRENSLVALLTSSELKAAVAGQPFIDILKKARLAAVSV